MIEVRHGKQLLYSISQQGSVIAYAGRMSNLQ